MNRHDEFDDDDYLGWDDFDEEVDTKDIPPASETQPQSRATIYLVLVVIALQSLQLVSGHSFKSDVRRELDSTNELIKELQERRVVNDLKAIREAKKAQ